MPRRLLLCIPRPSSSQLGECPLPAPGMHIDSGCNKLNRGWGTVSWGGIGGTSSGVVGGAHAHVGPTPRTCSTPLTVVPEVNSTWLPRLNRAGISAPQLAARPALPCSPSVCPVPLPGDMQASTLFCSPNNDVTNDSFTHAAPYPSSIELCSAGTGPQRYAGQARTDRAAVGSVHKPIVPARLPSWPAGWCAPTKLAGTSLAPAVRLICAWCACTHVVSLPACLAHPNARSASAAHYQGPSHCCAYLTALAGGLECRCEPRVCAQPAVCAACHSCLPLPVYATTL